MMTERIDPLELDSSVPSDEEIRRFGVLNGQSDCCGDEDALDQPAFLSARAARDPNLSVEEMETAEAEAFEWAKQVNRC